jgi:DNA polymerase
VHYAVQDGAVQNDMGQNHAAQGLADGDIAAPMPIATRSPDPSPIPVIVTYHPSYLLRNLPDKAKAWADLLLAMETLHATGQPNTGM